ncbi:MAG: LUD domain-containing protein [Gemmatimonadetes bacterium]|nr:LUD domain-containing protein [Gemmatimonadota bacterium]
MSARDRILERVRAVLPSREDAAHPGPFLGWRAGPLASDVPGWFSEMFTKAGGEVVRVGSPGLASAWLADFAAGFGTASVGATLPADLIPQLAIAPPEVAELGVSMGRGAVAETGSLILDARDGRRTQLLPPTHVVLVRVEDVHATLADALDHVSHDLPSAVGLHSGPSKSADIGQITVTGVHGPGRVLALIVG